jgi:hypothetical protein
MEIFISWSGPKSKAFAEALKDWLKKCLQAAKPWISSHDIDKGARWGQEISEKLGAVRFGIICCTSMNITSPWLLFEAGAISKLPGSRVYTVLIDLPPSQLEFPLAQFQATKAEKEDLYRLVSSINSSLDVGSLSEENLREVFDHWWPKLEDKLLSLPSEIVHAGPRRSQTELLEEILDGVRALGRSQTSNSFQPDSERQDPFEKELISYAVDQFAINNILKSLISLGFDYKRKAMLMYTRHGRFYAGVGPSLTTEVNFDSIRKTVESIALRASHSQGEVPTSPEEGLVPTK